MKSKNFLIYESANAEIYGIPKIRKFPLDTEAHVIIASKYYRFAEDKYKKELFENILKRAQELGVSYKKLLNKELIKELIKLNKE